MTGKLSFNMTMEMAREIKTTRMSSTYRTTATRFAQAHPELDVLPGNQIEGIDLCDEAARLLGEDQYDWK